MNAAPSEALAAICSRPCCPEDVIGQAKGILMERLKITPEDAFDLLRRSSQHLNIMREVARGLAGNREYRMVKPSATPTKQSGRSHSLGSNAECDHRHLPRCF